MGFFNFGNSDTIISFEEPKSNFYSFMERGDLVYFTPPGSNRRITATIEFFTTNENGTPDYIEIRTAAGELIETTIKHISY